jgi:hypothetical protein
MKMQNTSPLYDRILPGMYHTAREADGESLTPLPTALLPILTLAARHYLRHVFEELGPLATSDLTDAETELWNQMCLEAQSRTDDITDTLLGIGRGDEGGR